ncbi:D-2-hydroxyacid dehydrogenase family protein [Nocardioides sp. ChNu-99]|uniref:D-2-hydroxyacid dehydrogenase family protein n=1 Tax=Nocardioides sp. ChNu-99 TaxID=2839897 RepID=UPI0024061CE7|nr:D-2-hydroxyacid dehydrogenase family protein [Nocardioides sp. ChNu-99]
MADGRRSTVRVAVLDDHQGAFAGLAAARPLLDAPEHEVVTFPDAVTGDRLVARLDGFDAVVLLQQRTALPRAVVERLDTVRLVSQTGRHTDHLDLDACRERGIAVSAGGAGDPAATVELTWALVLAASRRVPEEVARLRSGGWQGSVGTLLRGRTLGVLGLGRIGTRVADVGRAFGMRVLVDGREGSRARALAAGHEVAADRAELFATSDVLTVHLPLVPATRGVVTADLLGRMRPDALFVNTSRAGLVAPGALAAAVAAGRPGRAAVDVFDVEPAEGDPLLRLPGVTATPHLGYVVTEVLESLYGAAVEQVLAFAAGRPVRVVVSAPGA